MFLNTDSCFSDLKLVGSEMTVPSNRTVTLRSGYTVNVFCAGLYWYG